MERCEAYVSADIKALLLVVKCKCLNAEGEAYCDVRYANRNLTNSFSL